MAIEEKRKKFRRTCHRLLGVPHSMHRVLTNIYQAYWPYVHVWGTLHIGKGALHTSTVIYRHGASRHCGLTSRPRTGIGYLPYRHTADAYTQRYRHMGLTFRHRGICA